MKHVSKGLYDYSVADHFGVKSAKGEVGIEVEIEGRDIPEELQYWWAIHQDGSLRTRKPGDQAVEFVLKQPVPRENVVKSLVYLEKYLEKSTVYTSPRTSVHVHLNFQDKSMVQVMNMITLWYILEEPLVAWCGPERVANLFCLRAQDAEQIVTDLVAYLQTGANVFSNENYRYAALNVNAIAKYGSLEFRALNGTVDGSRIAFWVDTLLMIKDKACEYKNPREIIEQVSGLGPMGFVQSIFQGNPKFTSLFTGWSNVWQAIRLAQELAYSMNWEPKIGGNPPRPKGKYSFLSTLPEEQLTVTTTAGVQMAGSTPPAGMWLEGQFHVYAVGGDSGVYFRDGHSGDMRWVVDQNNHFCQSIANNGGHGLWFVRPNQETYLLSLQGNTNA